MPHDGNGCEKRQWVLAALDQHEVRLTRYAARLAGDEEAARDAVQHVFLRLCDQQPAELNGRLLPWLYTVCRNKILDQLRREGRFESLDKADSSMVPGREPDPAAITEQQDLGEWLRELVEALPTSLREVLNLWLDGFSHIEISEITDRTPGHVRVLVHRALTRLREHPRTRDLLAEEHSPEQVSQTSQ
ncbi:MAG: sigma-70 family RNA polymerase sigma factor [Planctomycetaceae bacterium]|nr:sigma-70 family RNA polymerase sigma factor [Planctomycetales bacterium]MCB9921358.1 sigma-70 family RNA polymerase sigma factor [Planctomycetaceae bacterium]